MGPGSGSLKTYLGRQFKMVQSLTGERWGNGKRDSTIMYGERYIKTLR